MSSLDEFESMFRSASKELFSYEPPGVREVTIVTDLDGEGAAAFGRQVTQLLEHALPAPPHVTEINGQGSWFWSLQRRRARFT